MEEEVRVIDTDLDALLDSALADFGEDLPATPGCIDKKDASHSSLYSVKQPEPHTHSVHASGATAQSEQRSPAGENHEDKLNDKDLDEALDMLMAGDPFMKEQFGKFVETASKTDGTDAAGQHELAAALAETLGSLARNAESLKADFGGDDDEEDVMKAFAESLRLDGSDDMPAGIMPMMQDMMKSILSKDVLCPSLKDLADKFPSWLAKNKDKLSKKNYDSHARQFDIVVKILDIFEAETDKDPEVIKSQRFEAILSLMTQLQDCGALPKEIVGEMAPGLEFDDKGVPKLPGMDQCPIM